MILIARRRWRMGGTRFDARGIDDEGNCANFCELEQIFYIHTDHETPIAYKNQNDNTNCLIKKSAKMYSFV